MRYVEVDGVPVSAIGLGTWQFGSREWGYGEEYARRVAPALVRRALELGITFIDTAEAYGFGRSERIVGRALDGSAAGAFIATKLMPVLPLPRIVARQARASRDRLGVDSIDLYQLHWPNPIVPARTSMSGLRRLLDDGVVDRIGVSNHSLGQWRVAERALARPIATNQVRFSLASPAPRWELVPYATERGRVIVAYSPLAQGFLAGDRTVDDAPAARSIRRMNPLFRTSAARRARHLRGLVGEIASARAATPAQVALAWLVGHGNVVAIPGARTVAQLEENAAAADLVLSPAEHAALSSAADRFESALRG